MIYEDYFYWIDYYWSEWNNPERMVDLDPITFADVLGSFKLQINSENECDGTGITAITKVELQALCWTAGDDHIYFEPYFSDRALTGDWYPVPISTSHVYTELVDITNDSNAPTPWTWNDIKTLWFHIYSGDWWDRTYYCTILRMKVTSTDIIIKGAMQTGKYWGQPI